MEEADKVILRSDGTSTYIAKDIPYAVWKTGLVSDPFSYRKFAEQWDGSILWSNTQMIQIKREILFLTFNLGT